MPDRGSVITHLMIIHTWAEFARERDLQFFTPKHLENIAEWTDDAISLLKKQETQKFFVDESGKVTPLPVVVRCKDCIWFHKPDAETKKSCKCNYHGCVTEENKYCWWGEKDG